MHDIERSGAVSLHSDEIGFRSAIGPGHGSCMDSAMSLHIARVIAAKKAY